MQNLWRVQTEKKIHTPHDIISEQCKYLSEMTDGKVIARIAPYKGDYKSYSKSNELELAGRLFVQDNSFDVQNVLGDQQSKFIYEFYIIFPSYHLCYFFSHGNLVAKISTLYFSYSVVVKYTPHAIRTEPL